MCCCQWWRKFGERTHHRLNSLGPILRFLSQRDLLIPQEYPLPSSKNAPKPPTRLHIRFAQHDLRCCTGELYLGAITNRGVLAFFSCIDENVFDTELACEWTEEVKNAASYYLVETNDKLEDVEPPAARL